MNVSDMSADSRMHVTAPVEAPTAAARMKIVLVPDPLAGTTGGTIPASQTDQEEE
jgi:hypothetical protein